MNHPTFQIFQHSMSAEFYFRLKALNGETILCNEGYITKLLCQAGILSVKTNALFNMRYQRRDATGNFTFHLLGGFGEIIGKSEHYKSLSAREVGIASVKRDAPNALTEDLS